MLYEVITAVRRNGTGYWQSCRFLPRTNENGAFTGILAVLGDITERKQIEKTLQERLAFEELLSGLSARFVNLSPYEVDGEIEQALKQLLEFFPADRSGLLQLFPDKNRSCVPSTMEITREPGRINDSVLCSGVR